MLFNFNSIKVRLELVLRIPLESANRDFNSIKVRLEHAVNGVLPSPQ